MRYLILTLSFLLASCAPAKPQAPLVCAHPMFRGGQPFEVPTPYYFSHAGVLSFSLDAAHEVTLSGTVCLWTK